VPLILGIEIGIAVADVPAAELISLSVSEPTMIDKPAFSVYQLGQSFFSVCVVGIVAVPTDVLPCQTAVFLYGLTKGLFLDGALDAFEQNELDLKQDCCLLPLPLYLAPAPGQEAGLGCSAYLIPPVPEPPQTIWSS